MNRRHWRFLQALLFIFAVLLVTMLVKVNPWCSAHPLRLPLPAMLSGCGAMRLRAMERPRQCESRWLGWAADVAGGLRVADPPDYLTYFNELVDRSVADRVQRRKTAQQLGIQDGRRSLLQR